MFKKLFIMSALLLAAACTGPCNSCRCADGAGAKCICAEKGHCECAKAADGSVTGVCEHCKKGK